MKKPIFLISLLILHLLLLFNIRFTAWPEMFSFPYLFLKGFKLYSDFIHPYPPLLTLLLAGVYKIFGFKILTLKAISWLFILASDTFIFLIAKKFLKKETLVFLLLVPYLLIQSFLDGNMLWFDNALVLPVVAAFYFFTNWSERKKLSDLTLVSLFLTAGVFIKQTAAIYFVVFLLFYFFTKGKIVGREIIRIFLPPLIVGSLFLAYSLTTGILKDFWLWNFYYPLTFWSKFPGYQDFSLTLREKITFLLVLTPFAGVFLVKARILKDKVFLLIMALLISSIIAIYPRFNYMHAQPVFAISFIGFAFILSNLKRTWYLVSIWVVSLLIIYPAFNNSLVKSTRFYEEEDQKVISMVSALSTKDEKVFLVGPTSSTYVFADRLPPKPWAENFGWYLEVPGEAEQILTRFTENTPDKIFYKIPERGNWFDLGVYRPQKLVNYMNQYYYLDSEPIGGIELWKRKN